MKRKSKVGLPPDAIVFTGNQKVEKVDIHYLAYNKEALEETELDNHQKISFNTKSTQIDWYDIRGIHDEKLIEAIGGKFDINPMVLADVVDPSQRSTIEEYPTGIFIILKSITFNAIERKIHSEHLALYFSSDYLISFQEDHTDVFNMVRKRIHSNKGLVRSKNADYLAYALIDNVLDNNFIIADQIQDEIQKLEDQIIEGVGSQYRKDLHFLKKEILKMQKLISPLRESLSRLSRSSNEFLDPKNGIYFRDLHDTVIQIFDRLENQRDYLNGLQDLYISEISYKMNEVMKVLTIITTIFVPLSFLAGLYGMNFENMPELKSQNGYYYLIGVMLFMVVVFIFYFKKRKWL